MFSSWTWWMYFAHVFTGLRPDGEQRDEQFIFIGRRVFRFFRNSALVVVALVVVVVGIRVEIDFGFRFRSALLVAVADGDHAFRNGHLHGRYPQLVDPHLLFLLPFNRIINKKNE